MASTTVPHLPVNPPVILEKPLLHQDDSYPRHYGISTFFQVSPTQVAMLANRRVTPVPVVDHEDGFDIFVFDDLNQLTPDRAQPGVYQHVETHPGTGEKLAMVPHLPVGGFVPLGAKLPDGSDHPHAGTGFGLDAVVGHPVDHSSPIPLHRQGVPNHAFHRLYQYKFDGEKLHILSMDKVPDELVLGWRLGRRGLSPALQDGEDLITVMTGGIADEHVDAYFKRLEELGEKPRGSKDLGQCTGAIFTRWRYGAAGWGIVEVNRVVEPGPDMCGEPTLVRDADGSLLCSVRSKGSDAEPGERDARGMENLYQAFRVYLSLIHI